MIICVQYNVGTCKDNEVFGGFVAEDLFYWDTDDVNEDGAVFRHGKPEELYSDGYVPTGI